MPPGWFRWLLTAITIVFLGHAVATTQFLTVDPRVITVLILIGILVGGLGSEIYQWWQQPLPSETIQTGTGRHAIVHNLDFLRRHKVE